VRKENLAQDGICDRHRPALTAILLDRSLEATIASATKKMAMNETRLLASRRLSRRLPSGGDPAWHSPDTGVAWNLGRGSAVKLKPGERAMKSVQTRDAACSTLASFIVADGRPGPQKA